MCACMCVRVYGRTIIACARVYLRLDCVHVWREPPPLPETARYCVYMHIYRERGEEGRGRGKPPDSLSCTLTRRRFPIFQPKLSTEKPSDSPSSLFLSLSLGSSSPFSPRRLSYATSNRHIRTKSNVSRLNVSAMQPPSPVPRSPSVDAFEIFIIYKPRKSGPKLQRIYADHNSFSYFDDAFFFIT